MKLVLNDLSIVIPISIDNHDRLENLNIVYDYLNRHIDCELIIVDKKNIIDIPERIKHRVIYKRIKDDLPFQQTRLCNEGCKLSNKKNICFYDADVIMNKDQFFEACCLIDANPKSIVIGYDGTCYNVPRPYIKYIIDDKINNIPLKSCKKRRVNSLGGFIFFNREEFIKGGMYNENFVYWGGEDDELIFRFKTLGYEIKRANGCLYHIDHKRGQYARIFHPEYQKNKNELNKVSNMNREQIEKYIKTWEWCNYE